jgi:lipopolysaccharide transport system ATP-binding protein
MKETALKVSNLSKKYRLGTYKNTYSTLSENLIQLFKKNNKSKTDLFYAINDLNFEIKIGETCGIIGKNGSGKSTLLKLISQIVTPTEGLIYINGSLTSLLEVGTGFHPELTGRENIYLNASILGMPRKQIDMIVDDIIDFSGIGQFIDMQVKRYSSGMYIRLAFSIASHINSDILILDEVLAVGDAFFQKSVLEKINSISNSGKTILFVSHNISHILQYCNTAIYLDKGKMIMQGPVSDVVKKYIGNSQENQSNNNVVDLRNHSGRNKPMHYDRQLSLESIALMYNNQISRVFNYNQDIQIQIGFSLNSVMPKNFQVEVRIHDNRGFVISCITSSLKQILFTKKSFYVNLFIYQLNLIRGTYSISIACKLNGFWSDSIFDAITFEILESDNVVIYRNDDLSGIVHYKHKWEYHE